MSNKPILLITGINGLIGRAAARRFAEQFQVVGFDRAVESEQPENVDVLEVDLTSADSLIQGLASLHARYGGRIASVLHLAAYHNDAGEPSPLYQDVTVAGTERLLRALQFFDVGQFVFTSSMLVHAPCEPGEPIDESSPLEPKGPYPRSTAATERVVFSQRGTIPVVVPRIASVYNADCRSVPLAHQIQSIYERRLLSHVYPGDLAHGQAMLHRDDLVDALERIVSLRDRLPPEFVLLLGEMETLPYGDLQEWLGRLIHGQSWTTVFIPKTLGKAGTWVQEHLPLTESPLLKPAKIDRADDHYELQTSTARLILGWEPKHMLRQVLPEMVARLKADPVRWYQVNGLNLPKSLQRETAVVEV